MSTENTGIITVNTSGIEAADWLAKRAELAERAQAITQVTNDEELEVAGKFETDCKKQIKALSEIRLAMTRPLDAAKKSITDKEKELVKPLQKEQERVNGMTVAYATMLARKAEEERMAREAAEREAAEAALAAEDAQRAAEAAFGLEPSGVVDPIPVTPLPAVTTTGPHTSSNRFAEKWDFVIVDPNAVPRELCSPDERKIRALMQARKADGYKADQIKIDGIRISSSVQVYAR